ncbi:MAG: HypC/HybG/HupF family hydrogenase formation chaperone [Deltaproteobacteria bacterium]|nr:HypC/HybG/HupF family hydrogenase formation chaperone [Deltaproteobacteria bacterium]
MCLGIPGKIIELKGVKATIDVAGTRKVVNMKLLPDARTDEFVIVHAGFAIEKVDEEKAKEALDLIDGIIG